MNYPYTYALNNPLLYTDPTGWDPEYDWKTGKWYDSDQKDKDGNPKEMTWNDVLAWWGGQAGGGAGIEVYYENDAQKYFDKNLDPRYSDSKGEYGYWFEYGYSYGEEVYRVNQWVSLGNYNKNSNSSSNTQDFAKALAEYIPDPNLSPSQIEMFVGVGVTASLVYYLAATEMSVALGYPKLIPLTAQIAALTTNTIVYFDYIHTYSEMQNPNFSDNLRFFTNTSVFFIGSTQFGALPGATYSLFDHLGYYDWIYRLFDK